MTMDPTGIDPTYNPTEFRRQRQMELIDLVAELEWKKYVAWHRHWAQAHQLPEPEHAPFTELSDQNRQLFRLSAARMLFLLDGMGFLRALGTREDGWLIGDWLGCVLEDCIPFHPNGVLVWK